MSPDARALRLSPTSNNTIWWHPSTVVVVSTKWLVFSFTIFKHIYYIFVSFRLDQFQNQLQTRDTKNAMTCKRETTISCNKVRVSFIYWSFAVVSRAESERNTEITEYMYVSKHEWIQHRWGILCSAQERRSQKILISNVRVRRDFRGFGVLIAGNCRTLRWFSPFWTQCETAVVFVRRYVRTIYNNIRNDREMKNKIKHHQLLHLTVIIIITHHNEYAWRDRCVTVRVRDTLRTRTRS